jgi:transposase
MPRERVSMRKIREVLRLKWGLGLSERQVAQSCDMGRSTVADYLERATLAGLSWPLPENVDDRALESSLFPLVEEVKRKSHPTPNWESVHQELKRKGVTRLLLWREYLAHYPDGYSYCTFTVKYREWKQGLNVTMRQDHKAGEKLFVDYAGMTVAIVNKDTGEIAEAQVFVGVLGASNYTYTEVTNSQKLEDWLASHRRTFEFFGGVPEIVVPDNLKSGVTSPCYYEPELNWAYAELAQHYDVAVLPTRVRKPRDKAKVETGVKIVEENVLAPLRNRTFFSVREANEAIWSLLGKLNDKPFQKLPGSRKSLFEQLEKPTLRPLPVEPYVLAAWKKAKVNIDYHIEVDGHYYSVPFQFARQQIDVRLTSNTLEVYQQGKRIASHRRLPDLLHYRGRHSTLTEHMPKAHQKHLEWTPGRIITWAEKTGECTAKVVEEILASRPHPEQGYRSCMGIIRLAKTYGHSRLEAACKRACHFRAFSYKSVESILKNNLDREPLPDTAEEQDGKLHSHANIRGASYYQQNDRSL